jgi:hypothetical protein
MTFDSFHDVEQCLLTHGFKPVADSYDWISDAGDLIAIITTNGRQYRIVFRAVDI